MSFHSMEISWEEGAGVTTVPVEDTITESSAVNAYIEAKQAAEAAERFNKEFMARWGVPESAVPHAPITIEEIIARKAILAALK